MFYSEHWPDSYQGPAEADLRELINRAIRKLQRLNSQPSDGACLRKTFVKCEPFDTLRRIGMNWSIESSDGSGRSVLRACVYGSKQS